MRALTTTCIACMVMLSYSVIYKTLKLLTIVITFLLYRDKRSVLVEKRDEYLRKIARADEQIRQWACEGEENLLLFVLICSLLSVFMVGWLVCQLCIKFNYGGY